MFPCNFERLNIGFCKVGCSTIWMFPFDPVQFEMHRLGSLGNMFEI